MMKKFIIIHNLAIFPIIFLKKGCEYMEKQLKLIPLAEVGEGTAAVSENSVSIRISGVSGGLKAWLIGGKGKSADCTKWQHGAFHRTTPSF